MCNNEWMRDMDDAFMKHIGNAMASAQSASLTPAGQRAVANWAVKVALLTEIKIGDELDRGNPLVRPAQKGYVPDVHLERFFRDQRPPPNTQVWLGALDFDEQPQVRTNGAILGVPQYGEVGYVTAFCIGHVVLAVTGRDVFVPKGGPAQWIAPLMQVPDDYSGALVPIWQPRDTVVRWPGTRQVTRDEAIALPRRMLEHYVATRPKPTA
jgi:hypothetical protein